jgi:hypothetical protein
LNLSNKKIKEQYLIEDGKLQLDENEKNLIKGNITKIIGD